MSTVPSRFASRRALFTACCLAALAAFLSTVGGSAQAGTTVGPDVTVFNFTDVSSFGSADGFASFSVGTRSCNRGDAPLNWCDQANGCAPGVGDEEHPVIAQNLYRLKNGRFQQIGMSWLKHGFASGNESFAGCSGFGGQACTSPPAGLNQLGVGCTDPYFANLNGIRPLGRRSEVNATTGVFPFPPGGGGAASTVYDQRIKVATADLDGAQTSGALYWAEGQYVMSDDAGSGNGLNNASHRRVTVGEAPTYALTMTGPFFEMQPAIFAWPAQDPTVSLVSVDVPGPVAERFHVARKVTHLLSGLWRYEYAVHNLNSDRSARSLTVDFPEATQFINIGFKDIEHHSGEPYSTTDWQFTWSNTAVTWITESFANNPNANALRWSTMYNFWFDADRQPSAAINHTIGLFKPGDPASVDFQIFDLLRDGFESGDTSEWSGATGKREDRP
jgi:hypothetical protein